MYKTRFLNSQSSLWGISRQNTTWPPKTYSKNNSIQPKRFQVNQPQELVDLAASIQPNDADLGLRMLVLHGELNHLHAARPFLHHLHLGLLRSPHPLEPAVHMHRRCRWDQQLVCGWCIGVVAQPICVGGGRRGGVGVWVLLKVMAVGRSGLFQQRNTLLTCVCLCACACFRVCTCVCLCLNWTPSLTTARGSGCRKPCFPLHRPHTPQQMFI